MVTKISKDHENIAVKILQLITTNLLTLVNGFITERAQSCCWFLRRRLHNLPSQLCALSAADSLLFDSKEQSEFKCDLSSAGAADLFQEQMLMLLTAADRNNNELIIY